MDWILYPWGGKNSEWFKSQDLRQPWGFFKTHFLTLHWKYDVVKGWDVCFEFPQSKWITFERYQGDFTLRNTQWHIGLCLAKSPLPLEKILNFATPFLQSPCQVSLGFNPWVKTMTCALYSQTYLYYYYTVLTCYPWGIANLPLNRGWLFTITSLTKLR